MAGIPVLARRLELLQEIARIMESIKTIALIETQHSRASLDSQLRGVKAMGEACTDFIGAYVAEGVLAPAPPRVILMIGSERGFCGDYNASLVEQLAKHCKAEELSRCKLIPVGYRLGSKLRDDSRTVQVVSGANVTAELEATLNLILNVFAGLSSQQGFDTVRVLYHDAVSRSIKFEPLLQGLLEEVSANEPGYPPMVNLAPAALMEELMAEYVYARLYTILTLAFVAENEQRIQHLRNALDRIEEQSSELSKRQNQLRQEQITEELEIILLNSTEAEFTTLSV